jgi:hypothetical protein
MDPTKSVTMLNRVTFNKTVAQKLVDHWIVLFCVDWYQLCQGLWEDYKLMAVHWEQHLAENASSWQATAIRFAEVDCATDKALCNENNVQEYPSVHHFHNGRLASEWEPSKGATSLSKDISKWVTRELTRNGSSTSSNKNTGGLSRSYMLAQAAGAWNLISSGVRELIAHLSWKDPATAALGYAVLAINVVVLAWSLVTGFEVEWKTSILGLARTAKHKARPSALLPQLPELPEPRTIVRGSFVL